MVTMSFQSGSNTELFQEIRTIHASSLHSEIAVRIPDKPKKAIHSRRIAWDVKHVSGPSTTQELQGLTVLGFPTVLHAATL